ncbi:MAG: PDZ domain-containing protein [Alistipes sp.]|nr:PDZ domain-containing protein [Alistipes sp.]
MVKQFLYFLSGVIIAVIMCACAHTPLVLYVSPGGSDDADGTEAAPLATLRRAHELAAPAYGNRPVTVYLLAGEHYVDREVVFGPGQSGTAANPVRIASYGDGGAVLTTSVKLDGLEWVPYRDGIMAARVGDLPGSPLLFDRLFIDGREMPMARYPDYDPAAHYFNGTAGDALSPARTARWNDPAGGYVHALHRHEWGGFHYRIDGRDTEGDLLLTGGWQNNRRMGMHPQHLMVENVFEELDSPGEWYHNAAEGILYLYPPPGTDLSRADIRTPQGEGFFVVAGSAEEPVGHITFEGISFRHTVRSFMKTDEPLLRSDWTVYRGGALLFEGAEDCIVRGCDFEELGGNGVFLSGYNRRNRVEECRFRRLGASAVCFVGRPGAVRSPLFEYGERNDPDLMDTLPGPASPDYPSLCVVDNNLIHDIGLVEKQVAGVQISMAAGITVSRNSIYRVPRAGINIGDGTWGGHIIEWNDVFDTVLETGDHGAFNSWGRDRFWYADRTEMDSVNRARPGLALLDAVETTVLRNNRWRCDHGWDIDLDDGSSNYLIENNLCLNGGLKLREGILRRAENNVMVNNSFHPHVWFEGSGDVFRRNIITRGYYPVRIREWGADVDRNLFPDSASLARAQAAGTDARSLAGDALFVDPVSGDFRVAPGSPALEVGFVNFPMDRFGVQAPRLRALAETPEIPRLTYPGAEGDVATAEWFGAQVKDLSTEGERSATGMDGVYGVLVLDIAHDSPLRQAGLRENDVILKFNSRNTDNVADLLAQSARTRPGDRVRLTMMRDQRQQVINYLSR